MRLTLLAIALLAAGCAPPPDNEAAHDDNVVADNEVGTTGEAAAGPGSTPPAETNVAVPAGEGKPAPKPAAGEPYTARGQEPGWALKIDKGRIDYQGNYGEKLINVASPEPQQTADGRRYVTDRLTVAITYKRCNDAMSGHGYEHEVSVTADGETYPGCGGPRRTDWDM